MGTPLSLVKLPIVGCSLYSSCEVCARAQSLGCVWRHNERDCVLKYVTHKHSFTQQHIRAHRSSLPLFIVITQLLLCFRPGELVEADDLVRQCNKGEGKSDSGT